MIRKCLGIFMHYAAVLTTISSTIADGNGISYFKGVACFLPCYFLYKYKSVYYLFSKCERFDNLLKIFTYRITLFYSKGKETLINPSVFLFRKQVPLCCI